MKTARTVILLFSLLVIVFLTCRNRGPRIIKVDPAYYKWVSGYTGGVIGKRDPIRIELASDYKGNSQNNNVNQHSGETDTAALVTENTLPDSNILKEIFTFEPEINGRAHWLNSRVIEFIPNEDLESDKLYTVLFKLHRVADVPSAYRHMEYQFRTWEIRLHTESSGLVNYSEYSAEFQYLSGTIQSTDYFDTSKLSQIISAKQDDRNLPLRIEKQDDKLYKFYFDSIQRLESHSTVFLKWNGKVISSESKGEMEFAVLPLGDFSLESTRIKDNGDQEIELHFTDPIFPDQEFANYISIEGYKDPLTFSSNLNVIHVFLPTRLVGSKTIHIRKGLKNFARVGMAKEQETKEEFVKPKPGLRMSGNGNILPNSQGLRIPVESIGLRSVDIRVIKIFENNMHQFLQVNDLDGEDGMSRVGKVIFEKKIDLGITDSAQMLQWRKNILDLSKLIQTDIGSLYRVSMRFRASYTDCGCEQEHQAGYNWNEEEEEDANDFLSTNSFREDIDYDSRYYGYDEYYDDNGEKDPCTNNYYYGKAINRNILASDLGIIYKGDSEKKGYAFVSNLITAAPESNTTIEFYDYTKQLLVKTTSNELGMAEVQLPARPFLLVAKKGKQRGYLKLTPNLSKSMSRFDVDGEITRKGLKGFIYGERGVWRPGDSIYLTFILDQGTSNLPKYHPFILEFRDPSGQLLEKKTLKLGDGDIAAIPLVTGNAAPTGNYEVRIQLGNLMVTKNIDIETVKPNHLKIQMNFPENGLQVSENKKTEMQVKWLHGAEAPNLQAQVELVLKPKRNAFEKFKDYIFESPLRKNFQYRGTAFSGYLNEHGKTEIITEYTNFKDAPGVMQASFISKVTEKSGNVNMDKSESLLYPFKKYFGLYVPSNQDNNMLESGKKAKFELVCIDDKSNKIAAKNIKIRIFKIDWKWWYDQSEDHESNYLSRPATYQYFDTLVQAVNGSASFMFGIPANQWGRFLVLVSDESGEHETGSIIMYDYPYWGRQNNLENDAATLLALSTDKSKYKTGEEIKLTFPSKAGGRALISLETSKKVVQKFWINTMDRETHCSIRAGLEMSPNTYIHVSLIQPHLQTIHDLPIRMYGVIPVEIFDPATKIQPVIISANEFKPDKEARVSVSEISGKAMYYTLAIVDDGLLDLTHFKTPDPHSRFFAKEALGVKTWDLYDAVIGAHSGKMDKLLSIGGDGSYDEENGSKAQRFKPMVRFIGPFYLPAGQRKEHKIKIPNYIGSVRVMVVAKGNHAYGNCEKTVLVKQELMVLANLPRVLGPNETLKIPITVFAMDKSITNATVKFQVSGEAQVTGGNSAEILFKQPGEEMVYFDLKTNKAIGILKFRVDVQAGKFHSFESQEVEIRCPNPLESRNHDFVLKPGESAELPANWFGVKGSNSMSVQLSSLPVYGLQSRLEYLIEYPHGCIEQTTSAVFAQLYLNKIMNLNKDESQAIQTNILAALKRYRSFQTSDGGFAYWPGENESNAWGSNYAGNFLLEAEKYGYAIPPYMKDKWIQYQQNIAKNWSRKDYAYYYFRADEGNCQTQAYRLYLLALAGKPEMGAMNNLREESNIGIASTWQLASAYALCGKSEVSKSLVANLSWNVPKYNELGYTFGSDLRDKAMILECMANMNRQAGSQGLFDYVVGEINSSSQRSTQEAATCLKAICTWAGVNDKQMQVSLTESGGKVWNTGGSKSFTRFVFPEKQLGNNNKIMVKNNGSTLVYLRQILRGSALENNELAEQKGLNMSWYFTDDNGAVLNESKIALGQDFVANVQLINTGNKVYQEMALKEIFPSGWEIMDSRLFGGTDYPARYANMRDDRVYFYFDLNPNESKTFKIRLHASFEGEFYLPSPQAEAMYDEGIHCRAIGKKIKIVKASGV
ncbi:MAG: hypothetical protein KG003_08720 [Bacteroidetes bacterium]|nr:hypothetical protein [Bacteroidota bacterium]